MCIRDRDKAFEIYQKHECCQIYVLDNQYKKDDILLNNASKDYLLALGVKKEDILEKKNVDIFLMINICLLYTSRCV